MNYISSKELAKRWNISPTRVVTLAKEGRIPEAKLVGKCWVFPPDTRKPCDNRRKENRSTPKTPVFRFPLYFYSKYTEEEIEQEFTETERSLYRGEQLFYTGQYVECSERLHKLYVQTDDPVVRIGALYFLCIANINLRNYRQACFYYREIQRLYQTAIPYQKELIFILHDLETYFDGNDFYMNRFEMVSPQNYPAHMYTYLLLESAYSDMLRTMLQLASSNPVPYELYLCAEASDLSPLSALLLHMYLAGILMEKGDKNACLSHIHEACRIAEINHLEHSIAYMMQHAENMFTQSLLTENPEQFSRLKAFSEEFTAAINGLFEYNNKLTILQNLDAKDSLLLKYAIRGMMNKEIATAMGLSMATISKKYAVLYEKTGTHNKRELVQLYSESIKEF